MSNYCDENLTECLECELLFEPENSDMETCGKCLAKNGIVSPEMRRFLTRWLGWVERGAPNGNPFWREHGLCFNAGYCGSQFAEELSYLFASEFGPNVAYPFGEAIYKLDMASNAQHKNQKRIAWVKAKLETPE